MSKAMAITIEHLNFSYGEKEVFHDLSIAFPKGQASAVMGKSGRGKTTLLRMIAGLLPVKPECIRYATEPAACSFVFQENRLVEQIGVLGNLRMVNATLTASRLRQCLLEIGLAPEYLHKEAGKLSGGEQRRIAILRALLARYDILLLDEPFTGLDGDTKNLMLEYMKKHTVGKTVILVTHEREDALYLCGQNMFVL